MVRLLIQWREIALTNPRDGRWCVHDIELSLNLGLIVCVSLTPMNLQVAAPQTTIGIVSRESQIRLSKGFETRLKRELPWSQTNVQ